MAGFWFVSGLESLSREELLALVAALKAANEQLVARVEDLERQLGRNSGNSSMPPSSDVFAKPVRRMPPKSGRKRGNQPGAPGGGLALVEHPDAVADQFPASCADCGSTLAEVSVGFTRRQCHDVPPASVQVTETRWHRVRCGCGRVTAAPVPDDVPDNAVYGPHLQSLAVYLVVRQHIPVERTAELIRDLTGARVSTGWIASLLPKAAKLVAAPVKLVKALLVAGHLVHADETTTNIAGKRAWLHVACTDKLTLLGLRSRSRSGVAALGVLPEFSGTMVHDALWLYDSFGQARHQLCCAHVVRELTACAERYPGQIWPEQIRWALSQMIKVVAAARAEGLRCIPAERLRRWLIYYDSGVQHGLDLHPEDPWRRGQSDARNLLLRLCERRADYLRFTVDLTVPATNNQGERDLRPVKTQIKISGCHASENGAANWLTVRSYVSTAVKHGIGAFEAVRRAFNDDVWMPPVALEG